MQLICKYKQKLYVIYGPSIISWLTFSGWTKIKSLKKPKVIVVLVATFFFLDYCDLVAFRVNHSKHIIRLILDLPQRRYSFCFC